VTPGRKRGPLDSYQARRDFTRTPEPPGEGAGKARANRPAKRSPGEGSGEAARRFVIHEHSAQRLHWDLRLERDGVLVSWALPRGLPLEPKVNFIAPHTEDHPLAYLEFSGEIPAGSYGAGTMSIWDHGTYETLKWEPRKVEVALHGARIDARYALFAIGREDEPKDWMIHRMDPPADPGAQPMPAHVAPMLARLAALPREDAGWSYEVKWDGVRAVAYSEPGRLRFAGRNGTDVTDHYPELARLGRALGSHRAVLDGEIVRFDEAGRPSFAALQPRIGSATAARRLAATSPVTYVIFDLLWLDGHSLMDRPYDERREALAALALEGEHWRTPAPLAGAGADILEASRTSGLEGIVAKRADSRYRPGQRDGSWLKIKNTQRQELVVGGWTPGSGRRSGRVGALLLGVYDDTGALSYAGRVGSGFTEQELDKLEALLAPLVRENSPFVRGPTKPPRTATFTEPKLVVEVEFREWTKTGALRAPAYKGLRDDKPPAKVARERAEPAPLSLRGLGGDRTIVVRRSDKVLYPATGLTKRGVIDYYEAVAPVLLPHLRDRPLTVKRYPDGVDGKAFFEKNSPSHRPPWVRTFAVASGRGGATNYTVVDDLDTLLWLANLAALELHVPLGLASDLEHPGAVVFDLDPGPPATIVECCRVALLLEGTFAQLGLESFAKTSGSKGLQVYVPLGAGVSYEETKRFSSNLAQLLERAQPELVVSRMARALRPGKVLIDWSQNDPHKTTVCVYSLRATARPSVSTPVSWDEVRATLDSGDPRSLAFEHEAVLERVAHGGDLFAPVLALQQTLPAV
jgi:bifunctional non-homologous end joining protein LigD